MKIATSLVLFERKYIDRRKPYEKSQYLQYKQRKFIKNSEKKMIIYQKDYRVYLKIVF